MLPGTAAAPECMIRAPLLAAAYRCWGPCPSPRRWGRPPSCASDGRGAPATPPSLRTMAACAGGHHRSLPKHVEPDGMLAESECSAIGYDSYSGQACRLIASSVQTNGRACSKRCPVQGRSARTGARQRSETTGSQGAARHQLVLHCPRLAPRLDRCFLLVHCCCLQQCAAVCIALNQRPDIIRQDT